VQTIEEIIYVGDPMCSWCWGFAPELRRLRNQLRGKVRVSLCMGSLRSGHVWDGDFRQYLERQWNAVRTRTGQPFATELLERDAFDYTTEPACRAVCTARALDPEKAFKLLEALQRAFYEGRRDITDGKILCDIATTVGLDGDTFATLFHSEAMREQVTADRYKARAYGASTFPSLVVIDREGHLSVLRGYRTFGELKRLLRL
jgi:putative protein-disulfide isomerase